MKFSSSPSVFSHKVQPAPVLLLVAYHLVCRAWLASRQQGAWGNSAGLAVPVTIDTANCTSSTAAARSCRGSFTFLVALTDGTGCFSAGWNVSMALGVNVAVLASRATALGLLGPFDLPFCVIAETDKLASCIPICCCCLADTDHGQVGTASCS